MKILVTGATGNLGGKIVEFSAKKLATSDIITGTTNPASEKAQALAAQGFEVRKTEFEDQASFKKWVTKSILTNGKSKEYLTFEMLKIRKYINNRSQSRFGNIDVVKLA